MFKYVVVLLSLSVATNLQAQTANDVVRPYDSDFGQGINFGWYAGWTDDNLARLSTGTYDKRVLGVGVNAVRPGLFAHFLEQWNYKVREDVFKTYFDLGAKDNVVIVGFPSDEQQGFEEFCPGVRSKMFKGMWEPIWDDGNGTPYNEANAYAAYLYKAVQVYGPYIRFYEIWNEPDIGDGPNDGWKSRRYEGNWYDNAIDPCQLQIKAPPQAYVRMLRISYEIIKRLDPDAYVAVGGLGYPSYLDNLLRMTDEPTSGKVTPAYPLTGGAYFDALSIHVYPHLGETVKQWNHPAGRFDYTRNSDNLVDGFVERLADFESDLALYGYDGSKYPRKVALCTEVNVPRRHFHDPGAVHSSPQMARNFILKLFARAQALGVAQVHPYQISDNRTEAQATGEFDLMGFYKSIANKNFNQVERTEQGIASASYAELLRGAKYDAQLTAGLQLPAGAEGVGFRLRSGRTGYLVWARTVRDGQENNTLSYTLPPSIGSGTHVAAYWNYNLTGDRKIVRGTITLSGAPTFLIDYDEFRDVSGLFDLQPGNARNLVAWPNPLRAEVGELNVQLPASPRAWQVEVFDALGRTVSVASFPANGKDVSVTLEGTKLVSGTYQITATGGDERLVGSFVVVD